MLHATPSVKPACVLMTLDAVGGVWRYAVDAARGLAGRGIDCILVGLGPRPSSRVSAEADAIDGVTLIWIEAPLDWMTQDETALDSIPGVLEQIAADYRVDLLHLNAPSLAVGLSGNRPVAVTSHSCLVTWWQAMRREPLPACWAWQKQRNLRGLEAADLVLAPSRSHADALRAAYGFDRPVRVVPNSTRSARASEDRKLFALAAGRWWDEAKNGLVLDAAARRLEVPVLIAGDLEGPNGEALRPSHALATGSLAPGRLCALMAQAAVFVGPSKYEPFGLSLLEAASTGAPMVVSDIPTFRELWDGTAIFCPPDDPEAFAAAIERLAKDAQLRRDLGCAARARARQFAPEQQISELLDAYATILATSAPARVEGP